MGTVGMPYSRHQASMYNTTKWRSVSSIPQILRIFSTFLLLYVWPERLFFFFSQDSAEPAERERGGQVRWPNDQLTWINRCTPAYTLAIHGSVDRSPELAGRKPPAAITTSREVREFSHIKKKKRERRRRRNERERNEQDVQGEEYVYRLFICDTIIQLWS
jgi:hypothetical protein